MTIGTDGHIRVWDFETVDTADVTDESSVFEMDPMNELHVGNNVSLKTLVKSVDSEEPTIWYAQVGRNLYSSEARAFYLLNYVAWTFMADDSNGRQFNYPPSTSFFHFVNLIRVDHFMISV